MPTNLYKLAGVNLQSIADRWFGFHESARKKPQPPPGMAETGAVASPERHEERGQLNHYPKSNERTSDPSDADERLDDRTNNDDDHPDQIVPPGDAILIQHKDIFLSFS